MLRRHPGVGADTRRAPTALCDHYDASWFVEQVCPGETAICLSHHWYSDVWPYKRRANGTSAGATSHNFCRNAAREMQSYALRPSSETTVARASFSRVARSRADSASTPARVRSANYSFEVFPCVFCRVSLMVFSASNNLLFLFFCFRWLCIFVAKAVSACFLTFPKRCCKLWIHASASCF